MTKYNFNVPIPECPEDREARTQALLEGLEERILVLDGATGTGLQDENLTAEDFGGPDLEGCNENLCRTRPDVVLRLHRRYLAAGADIVETNSLVARHWSWPNMISRPRPSSSIDSRLPWPAKHARVSMSLVVPDLSAVPWGPPPRPSR